MKGIRLGNKQSKYPIIQGGMGVGVTFVVAMHTELKNYFQCMI